MARPAVVLVHGVRTSSSMWRRQIAVLTELGYRTSAIDLPGHGSRRAETFTLDGAARAIEEAVTGPDTIVAGLSLGGYVTMHWAARTRRTPRGLVLSSCTARTAGPGHHAFVAASTLIAALPGDAATSLSDTAARRAVGAPGARDIAGGGISSENQVTTLRAVLAARPLEDLRRITVPVHFVLGRLDHFRIDERAFRRAAPAARTSYVSGANHLVSLHRPVRFDRALLEALGEIEDRTAETSSPASAPRSRVPGGRVGS